MFMFKIYRPLYYSRIRAYSLKLCISVTYICGVDSGSIPSPKPKIEIVT